jgi:hypothetical protein
MLPDRKGKLRIGKSKSSRLSYSEVAICHWSQCQVKYLDVLVFTICHKYDILNGMPRKLLYHTGSRYVSRRKRLYHLLERVISPMPSNPSCALIVRFHIISSGSKFKALSKQIVRRVSFIF